MSTEKLDLFKCQSCTNLVEVARSGIGELVCCNEPMVKVVENQADIQNVHFAHIEDFEGENDFKQVVIKHEMTPEHHIEFIEIISNDQKYIKRKSLADEQEAKILLKCDNKDFYVRLHCNIHGCWVSRYGG